MASKIAAKGAADRCRMRGGRAAISGGTKVPEENPYVCPRPASRPEHAFLKETGLMWHVPLLDELAIVAALAVAVTVILSRLQLPPWPGSSRRGDAA
ncbi:MAG: hypothetical protein IPK13_00195 [Deltaproteobacteria bacterium]|nr:hypothetical protein [Deltaproteobacteria bacterium]